GADPALPPFLLAGALVERDQRGAFDGGVDDDEVLVEGRAGRRTEHVLARADARRPERLAVEIEGVHTGLAEEDIDVLAIGDRGAGGVAVLAHHAAEVGFGELGFDLLLPEDVPLLAVETEDEELELLLLGIGRALAEAPLAEPAAEASLADGGAIAGVA